MIENAILKRLKTYNEVCFASYSSPIGNLYILGDAASLKAIVIQPTTQLIKTFFTHFNQSAIGPVQHAIVFFDAFFAVSKKNITQFPEIIINNPIPERSDIVLTINGQRLVLDCSHFTPLEIRVYSALLKTKAGSTISYSALAGLAGAPRASRFVGSTMAKNAFPIMIPCHRVIKSDGSIGNYTGGTSIKRYLLNHEK